MEKKTCFYCNRHFDGYANQMYCSPRCRYKYYHRSDMVLTLTKNWFDMILSGVKTEEYRIMKPYWEKRFQNYFGQIWDFSKETPEIVWNKQKKVIVFRNGYGKNCPEFSAECTIREDYGNEEWGAEKGKKYYVLTIHRIFNVKNIKE